MSSISNSSLMRCKVLITFLLFVTSSFVSGFVGNTNNNSNNKVTTTTTTIHQVTTTRRRTIRRNADVVQLNMWNKDDGNIDGIDRVYACIPYLLPLLDGDHFGRYVYNRIPALGYADAILLRPIENVYEQIPYASLIFFFALTLGSRNLTNISNGVRFNAQQAALIDIILVFPELFGALTGGMNIPRYVMEPSSTFVYYTYMACIIYSFVSNLKGEKPNKIPFISQAAEANTGMF